MKATLKTAKREKHLVEFFPTIGPVCVSYTGHKMKTASLREIEELAWNRMRTYQRLLKALQ